MDTLYFRLAGTLVIKSSVKDLLGSGAAKLGWKSCRSPCNEIVMKCRAAVRQVNLPIGRLNSWMFPR